MINLRWSLCTTCFVADSKCVFVAVFGHLFVERYSKQIIVFFIGAIALCFTKITVY
jgi:cytochrome c oxidase subunit IV